MTYDDGEKFVGSFENGHRSEGCLRQNNGDKFVGTFEDGLPYGGTMTFSNGDEFEGVFKEGRPLNGILSYPGGDEFDGHFDKDGNPFNGTLTFDEGTCKFEGDIENGKPWSGICTDERGDKFEMEDGKCIEVLEDSRLQTQSAPPVRREERPRVVMRAASFRRRLEELTGHSTISRILREENRTAHRLP